MEQHGVQILGSMKPEYKSVLTPEAAAFAGHIQRKFGARVLDLLQKRNERQAKYASRALGHAIGWKFALQHLLVACRFDAGEKPDFLPETKPIRNGNWKV